MVMSELDLLPAMIHNTHNKKLVKRNYIINVTGRMVL